MSTASEPTVVRIQCPGCQATLKLKGTIPPGKRIACPKCGTKLQTPGGANPAPARKPSAGSPTARPTPPAPKQRPANSDGDWLNDLDGFDDKNFSSKNTPMIPPRINSKKKPTAASDDDAYPRRTRTLDDVRGNSSVSWFSNFFGDFAELVGAILGGFIGGAIGASIWAGIAIATHYEIGWIAWAVGALVGFGVRVGSGGEEGPLLGGLAVIIAFLSIALGRTASIYFVLTNLGEFPPDMGVPLKIWASIMLLPFTMSFWSVLWLGLAGLSAFKIGSGLTTGE